jgi:hydrogenase maturation protease
MSRGRGEWASVAPVLVLGVGNILLGDDGVGVRLVSELAERVARWGGRVELVDGGTLGLSLIGHLEGRKALIILDAVRSGGAPGSVLVFSPDEVGRVRAPEGMSPHEGSALVILRAAALLGDLPAEVAIVGVEPERVETGVGLSPAVEEGLGPAVALAVALIDRLSARC